MRGLIFILQKISLLLASTWRFIPQGFMAIFVVYTFFNTLIHKGLETASTELATTILGAEQTIHTQVSLAIQHSPEYTFHGFLMIINSVLILYFLILFLSKVFIGITGSQANWGAFLMSVLVVGIIEFAVVKLITGNFFFPIKDGILYLLFHLSPVINNIMWPWTSFIHETSINTTNLNISVMK